MMTILTLIDFATMVDAQDLRRLVNACHPARDHDPSLRFPGLTGVHLEFEGSKLTGVATDSRSMTIVECNHDTITNGDSDPVFDSATFDLTKLFAKRTSLNSTSNIVVVNFSRSNVKFGWTNNAGSSRERSFEIECPVIEGRFPKWKQIPKPMSDYDDLIVVDSDEWVEHWDDKRPSSSNFEWDLPAAANHGKETRTLTMTRPAEDMSFRIKRMEGKPMDTIMLDMDRVIAVLKRMYGTVTIRTSGWGDPIRFDDSTGTVSILMPMARRN